MNEELLSAFREWWHQKARHGETASAAATSLEKHLLERGFMIVRAERHLAATEWSLDPERV